MNKNKVTVSLRGQNEQVIKLPGVMRNSFITYLETEAVRISIEHRQSKDLKDLKNLVRILKLELREIKLESSERVYLEWFLCEECQNDRLEMKRDLSSQRLTKLVFC